MIYKKKRFFIESLRILYQEEVLDKLLDKNKYDLMTVIAYKDLDLEKAGFWLKRKKLANIYLDGTVEGVLGRFTRTTRQEVQKTYKVPELVFRTDDPNKELTYKLYKDFELAQGRKPWGRDTFDGVINFNAYYKGELIASVPCYDLFPYLQVRAMFSKRMEIASGDKEIYRLIGSATRRLIFEACKYGIEKGYEFVGLGSVNYSTEQKSNVADFKMFFGPRIGDEYTYTYKSSRLLFFEKIRRLIGVGF